MTRDGVSIETEKTRDAVHDVLMVRFWNEEVRGKVYERIGGWLEGVMNDSEARGGAKRREIGEGVKRDRANSSTLSISSVRLNGGNGNGNDENVGSNGLGTSPKQGGGKGRRLLQRAASSCSLLVPGVSSSRNRSSSNASSSNGGGGGSPLNQSLSTEGGAVFKRTSSSMSNSSTSAAGGGAGGAGGVTGDFGKGHASDRVEIVQEHRDE